MKFVTYTELAERHGHARASEFLSLLERLTEIRDEIISINKDERFKKALEALNNTNFA